MKVLVAGGSGFLGSHVADALSEAGHSVIIFDRRKSPWLRPGQRMVVGDILNAPHLERAVRGCQAVYNFAGLADIDEARDRPLDALRQNVLGNAILLEACRKGGVKRYIFASSVYVYSGKGSFYRATKQSCELYIEAYREAYGLPYTILRFGSLYGRRSDDRNAIHLLLRQALQEKCISYWGTGEEIREYIHADDAARASVEILKPAFKNQIVVISGHQPMRVRDLLVMIREMLGNRIRVKFSPRGRYADTHYQLTPYLFHPRVAKKLILSTYMDMGQGLLDCLHELQEQLGLDRSSSIKIRRR